MQKFILSLPRWLFTAVAVLTLLTKVLIPHSANAQAYAQGLVFKAADGYHYVISNLEIGVGVSPNERVTFALIVVECGAPFNSDPGWQLSFVNERAQFRQLFVRGEPLTAITMLSSINNYMLEHGETPIDRVTVAPGIVDHIYHFEVHCYPTIDNGHPSTVRLRLFNLTDQWSVHETFTSKWIQLPNINNLWVDGAASGPEELLTFVAR